MNNNIRYLSSVARYLCKQLLFPNYLIFINPHGLNNVHLIEWKKIQDICFETPPLHVACQVSIQKVYVIKNCSASKMKLSGWWSLIFPGIYVPSISSDFQMEKRRQHLRLKSVSFLWIFPRKKLRSINKYIIEVRPKQ